MGRESEEPADRKRSSGEQPTEPVSLESSSASEAGEQSTPAEDPGTLEFGPIQLEDLCFIDESARAMRWMTAFSKMSLLLLRLLRVVVIEQPVIYRGAKGWWKTVTLCDLAERLGITDPRATSLVKLHQRRLVRRALAILSINLPVTVLLATLLPTALLSWGMDWLMSGSADEVAVVIALSIALPMLMIVSTGAVLKLTSALVDKRYADTLSVTAALFLLCELARDDVLLDPRKRRLLLRHIDAFARLPRLLGAGLAGRSEVTWKWASQHFRSLELYIRSAEKEAIAPTSGTLVALRSQAQTLVEVFLFGRYGEDVWQGSQPDAQLLQYAQPEPPARRLQRLVGLLIPVGVTTLLSLRPDLAERVGLDPQLLLLIMITWLVLAVDACVGLGVVEKALKAVREIRQLK